MSNFSTLPAIGLIAAASAAFGLHLGESAIQEIDPVYFRGPAVHPSARGAALDPNEIAAEAQEPRFASLYGWEEGNAARAENCIDCDALAARDTYAHDFEEAVYDYAETMERAADYLDRAEARWLGESSDEDRAEQEWAEEEARQTDREDVVRYAYYPLTDHEAARQERPERARESEEPEQPEGLKIVYTNPAGGL